MRKRFLAVLLLAAILIPGEGLAECDFTALAGRLDKSTDRMEALSNRERNQQVMCMQIESGWRDCRRKLRAIKKRKIRAARRSASIEQALEACQGEEGFLHDSR